MERKEDNRTRMEVNKMPHRDRTGPMGRGSRTGRVDGSCNRYDMPGYSNRGVIYRVGGRRNMSTGGGQRNRHWYYATGLPSWMRGGRSFPRSPWGAPTVSPAPSRGEELDMLRDKTAYFVEILDEMIQRISKLESQLETNENQTGG